jgi:hypothetical protein
MGSTLHVTARRPQGTQFLFAVRMPEAAGIRLAT